MKLQVKGCLLLAAWLVAVPGGVAQAAPRIVDVAGSEIAFKVTQMGVDVSGRFSRFDGVVELDPARLDAASAQINVDIGSLTTGDADADAVALEEAWLSQKVFPKASFTSNKLKLVGANRYEASGTLTIRGKTRVLTVPLGVETAKDGTLTAVGKLDLKRSDFAIGGGEWNEGDLVADQVPVNFRLHLVNKP